MKRMKHEPRTNSDYIEWLKGCRKSFLIDYAKGLGIPFNNGLSSNNIKSSNEFRWQILEYNSDIVLKAPELCDFIPCDKEGNVLEEPINWEWVLENERVCDESLIKVCKAYQEAKERCLFENVYASSIWDDYDKVADENNNFKEYSINGVIVFTLINGSDVDWNFEKIEQVIAEINV